MMPILLLACDVLKQFRLSRPGITVLRTQPQAGRGVEAGSGSLLWKANMSAVAEGANPDS